MVVSLDTLAVADRKGRKQDGFYDETPLLRVGHHVPQRFVLRQSPARPDLPRDVCIVDQEQDRLVASLQFRLGRSLPARIAFATYSFCVSSHQFLLLLAVILICFRTRPM